MQPTDSEIAQLKAGMAALEAQRSLLGDEVVEAALASLRERVFALEAQAQHDQQRKQATVLFADVSGFTALSENLDVEVIAGIMNDLWTQVDRAIIDHGGHIDKHIGDAVMALWGTDMAREDDPAQAIRAALAMQSAVQAFSASNSAPLALRIGINTGPVLFGQVGTTGEFTAIGDTVNLASRLENAAPVGEVLISHDTYRHVRGVFDVTVQALLSVKGKATPVRTYTVQRAKPRAFRLATRGVEGIETRMVGRERELGILRDMFAAALAGGEARVVTIVGDAGVGKSRLLYEFDHWIEIQPGQTNIFKGRSTQNLQNVAYGLFRDLFAFRFNILDSDSTAIALDKFRSGMAGELEPSLADVAGHLLGFDFSSSDAVKTLLGSPGFGTIARTHLTRYFRALAAAGPVVMMLEDIHWADDQSLDLIAHLATTIATGPFFIVAAARQSLFDRRPNWGKGGTAFHEVNLAPLSKRATHSLVNEILRPIEAAPESLRELIVDSADGNPFYVEELIKSLIEQGVIERGHLPEIEEKTGQEPAKNDPKVAPTKNKTWRVRMDKLENVTVPPTLTGLLQARLDSLPRPEREALQRASVVGRLFWDDAVADLLEMGCDALYPTLEAICRRELIFRRDYSSFAGIDEYLFKHGLLRDVVYETVLLKRRAVYHGRVARWLEAHAGERLGEYRSLIAEHYVQAGERLAAAALLERAGEEANRAGLSAPARQALERALALRAAAGETDGPVVMKSLIELSRAYLSLGDSSAAEAALERGLAGAHEAGDSPTEAEAMIGLAMIANARGAFEQARTLAEAALPLGRAAGGRTEARVEWAGAYANWSTGDLAAAEAHGLRSLAVARQIGETVAEIDALNVLANIAASSRDLARSTAYDEETLVLARRTNHLVFEARALLNLGYIDYMRGDFAAARARGREALERSRELGARLQTVTVLGNLAQADLKLGDMAAAHRGARETLALARELGYTPSVAAAVFLSGQILEAEGRITPALALFGLARAHPSLEHQIRLESDDDIAQLALPTAEVEAGLAVGAALDFDTVVQEILDGKW